MSNIINFPGVTLADHDPEKILDGAKDEKLDYVLVLGMSEDGEEYFASSSSDLHCALWVAKRFEKFVLELGDDYQP